MADEESAASDGDRDPKPATEPGEEPGSDPAATSAADDSRDDDEPAGAGDANGSPSSAPTARGDGDPPAPDPPPSTDPREDWGAALAETEELTPAIVDAITDEHGDRGAKAVEAVAERRVKEYRDFTVVVGYEDEYVVEDGGCTCADQRYNLDVDDESQLCWHAIAVLIAERVGEVDYHDMWYSDVRDFL